MKLDYIAVYENNYLEQVRYGVLSDQGQGHCATSRFFSIYHNTNRQVHNSTLVQAGWLIFSMYIHLILIYKIYEYHYA